MPAATVFAATFPTWQVAVGALLAGFASGVLAALLGIGGAVVTTPVVRLLGGTPIEAVGSTVPAIIPGAISGAWRYAREGLVHWRIAGVLGVSGAAMAVVGALVSGTVEGRVLMVLTAVVMLWAGGSVVWRLRVPGRTGAGVADGADEVPEAPDALVAALGAGAGFIAGLLGVGGGIVIVPVLSGPLRLPMRSAVASSLVAVATFQVPALVTHIWLGHVDWMIAVPLALGVVPGAQVGARLTIAASDRTVRALFGMLVVVMAVIYGVSEARGLLVGS